jgi:hypothetical protein
MPGYPNRCQHLKINGTQCGSPALRRNRFCFFHKRFQDERIRLNASRARRGSGTFILPLLEDANSIQITLMQVMRLLVSQQIEHKTASLLLYALQTASTNLRMTKFEPYLHEVILDPRDAADSPLDVPNLWDEEDFEDEKDEAETETDRAVAALEKAKADREAEDKWMRWAERQYPRQKPTDATRVSDPKPPTPAPKPKALPDLKKPPAEATPAEVRAQITAMVRQRLPELTKVLQDAKAKDERKEKEKQKQAT